MSATKVKPVDKQEGLQLREGEVRCRLCKNGFLPASSVAKYDDAYATSSDRVKAILGGIQGQLQNKCWECFMKRATWHATGRAP